MTKGHDYEQGHDRTSGGGAVVGGTPAIIVALGRRVVKREAGPHLPTVRVTHKALGREERNGFRELDRCAQPVSPYPAAYVCYILHRQRENAPTGAADRLQEPKVRAWNSSPCFPNHSQDRMGCGRALFSQHVSTHLSRGAGEQDLGSNASLRHGNGSVTPSCVRAHLARSPARKLAKLLGLTKQRRHL